MKTTFQSLLIAILLILSVLVATAQENMSTKQVDSVMKNSTLLKPIAGSYLTGDSSRYFRIETYKPLIRMYREYHGVYQFLIDPKRISREVIWTSDSTFIIKTK